MRTQCEMCNQWRGRRPQKEPPVETWEVHKGVSIPFKPAPPPFVCASCRAKGAPDDERCNGVNNAGDRCKHWRLYNNRYCTQHKPEGSV